MAGQEHEGIQQEADGHGLKPPFLSFTFLIALLPSPPLPTFLRRTSSLLPPKSNQPTLERTTLQSFSPLSWLPALSPQIHSSFFHLKTSSPSHCYPVGAPALLLTDLLTAKGPLFSLLAFLEFLHGFRQIPSLLLISPLDKHLFLWPHISLKMEGE